MKLEYQVKLQNPPNHLKYAATLKTRVNCAIRRFALLAAAYGKQGLRLSEPLFW